MKTPPPIIEIKNLGLKINDTWIHRHLDLTIFKGEILAVVGSSGCGKTMLLRQILQLQPPTTGSIKILGIDTLTATEAELHKIRKNWGVVFQQDALFTSLTTLENTAFPLTHYTDLDNSIINELAMLKIKLAGLSEDAAWKYPDELSGGMQKRAAIARACALDPILLFLDEPTAGLDPQAAHEFDEMILRLKSSLNLTVIMATHDLDTLWRISDRVAFLGEKHVLGLGTMPELLVNNNPSIENYFNGPRGRQRRRGEEHHKWKVE